MQTLVYQVYALIYIFLYSNKNSFKGIKNLWKIVVIIVVLLIAIPLVSVLLVRQHNVQTLLVKRVLKELSEQTGTTISVKEVKFSFFHDLSLEDVFIADRHNDTLLFAQSLKANFDTLKVFEKKMYVSKLKLEGATGKVKHYGADNFNFSFLIDSLSARDTLPKEKWKLGLRRIELESADLAYYGKQNYRINDTELEADLLSLRKDSLSIDVKSMSFVDTVGIVLNEFKTVFLLTDNMLSVESLDFQTSNSAASIPLAQVESEEVLMHLLSEGTKVRFVVDEARVASADLKRFFPDFIDISEQMVFSGNIRGMVGDLKGYDLLLSAGGAFDLLFSLSITGLPDFRNSFIYADFSRMFISPQYVMPEVEKLTGKPFPLKTELQKFGRLLYAGSVTGFPGDFVAYGELNSELGAINADLSLTDNTFNQKLELNGKVSTEGFNLGKFLEKQDDLGFVSMNIEVEADKPYDENIAMFMNGEVTSLEFKGYTYTNIFLRGVLGSKHFNGGVNINDPNVSMLFTGRVDFSDIEPIFDFEADIRRFAPYSLKLTDKFEDAVITTQLKTKLKGSRIDNLEGFIGIYDLNYSNRNGTLSTDNATVYFNKEEDFNTISVNSDWLNGQIKGDYQFKELKNSLIDIIHPVFPVISNRLGHREMVGENRFEFTAEFSSIDSLAQVLELPFSVSSEGSVKGLFDDGYEEMNLALKMNKFRFKKFVLDTLDLKLSRQGDSMIVADLALSKLELNKRFVENIDLSLASRADSIENILTWENNNKVKYQGNISTALLISNSEEDLLHYTINVRSSEMTISDTIWNIRPSSLGFDTTGVDITSFFISNNNRYLKADGRLSQSKTDTFNLDVNGFELDYLSQFLNLKNLLLQGSITGQSVINAGLGTPVINSDFTVKDFVLNTIYAGDMDVKSDWDEKGRKMNIYGENILSDSQDMFINGAYFPSEDSLILNADMENLPVKFIQPYLENILQDLKGRGTGEMSLQGNVRDLKLLGKIFVNEGSFNVDYLNTQYYLSDTIHFIQDAIVFDNVEVFDRDGNSGIFNGELKHKTFKEMKFDMLLDFDNMLALNTTTKDNDLYYGTVYGTGILSIYGEGSKVHMNINARTDRNTEIFLPLTSNQVAAESNFVRFVTQEEQEEEEEQEVFDESSGFSFSMEVEATPDARVELIFDSRIGDVIKGQGSGTLVFNYDSKTDFKMFGDYTVSSGEYLFTAQNVINKRFDIEPGGVIKWSGDPYDATLDLDAYYRTKAPLYDLLPATVDDVNKSLRVPVNCHMILTENLMNPAIKFDVVLPTADQVTQQQIGDVLSSENEVQRQVIYLLMFNRFYMPDRFRGDNQNYANSNQAAVVTGSEFLSNQLSNWLSQISDEFDLGFNYRPADADQLTRQEVEVMLSTQMFNDKLSINGNFGYRETNTQSASNFVGDFDVDYRLNQKGNFKLKAYSHTNDNIIYENSPTTQGFGFVYKEEFDSFGELVQRYKMLISKNKKDEAEQEEEQNVSSK